MHHIITAGTTPMGPCGKATVSRWYAFSCSQGLWENCGDEKVSKFSLLFLQFIITFNIFFPPLLIKVIYKPYIALKKSYKIVKTSKKTEWPSNYLRQSSEKLQQLYKSCKVRRISRLEFILARPCKVKKSAKVFNQSTEITVNFWAGFYVCSYSPMEVAVSRRLSLF